MKTIGTTLYHYKDNYDYVVFLMPKTFTKKKTSWEDLKNRETICFKARENGTKEFAQFYKQFCDNELIELFKQDENTLFLIAYK